MAVTHTDVPQLPADRNDAIRNPVLPGFHPDPSILRVGADYYIANSTFEWYPGVRIHHSRDLVHWRPVGGALTEHRLLDLTGCRDSGGVWAPCLSYCDGLFHLIYTNVDTYAGAFWDTPNYLTTAPEIHGPWSEPVPLHARGFDPSLFHDEDGRSWLLSTVCDWRPGRDSFAGIIAQQFDRTQRRLVGEPVTIFHGTSVGVTEAPHLYRRDGWYYLMTAEGGTGWEHQATVARSRSVTGPYEVDPAGPLVTAVNHPELTLQKAGHGSLVTTQNNEWYLAHLTSRPFTSRGRCVLGRETALQRVEWSDDGWPRLVAGIPYDVVPAPTLPPHPWPEQAPDRDDFDSPTLAPDWSTLRRPATPEWVSPDERPGHLRIHGGASPSSRRRPSLVGQRVRHHWCSFSTVVEFSPTCYQHMAGLTAYYNSRQWHYLCVSHDEQYGVCARVLSSDRGVVREIGAPISLADWPRVHLRADINGDLLRFGLAQDGEPWFMLPEVLDASILSDDYAWELVDGEVQRMGFTGAFFGLWVQDLTGGDIVADFDHAQYEAT